MDMAHRFMTEKSGFIHTEDLGFLTQVVCREDQFMLEVT